MKEKRRNEKREATQSLSEIWSKLPALSHNHPFISAGLPADVFHIPKRAVTYSHSSAAAPKKE
jgi:hypothetical protein